LNINDYIKELLFTNQGVILPGLGGFVSEYEPAAFDVNENKFLPPSKRILFNSEYSYQDDLLSNYISKKEKIEKEESKKRIDNFVKEINQKLKKGEKIEFPEIGTLESTKGKIIFTQNKDSNLLTDSFGLTSLKAKKSKLEPTKIKPAKQKRSSKKLVIIGSFVIIFLLLIASAWYFTSGFSDFRTFSSSNTNYPLVQTEENRLKEITERNLDSIAKADSIKALIVHSIDNNTEKKDALYYQEPQKPARPADEEELKPQYSEFHIIAGSFKNIENAEMFANELREKGFNPEILNSGENLIRIAIYTYSSETEALTKLYKLRETSEIKSVWILKSI
jgi:hypothetical protein